MDGKRSASPPREEAGQTLTFWDHLDVLRAALIRMAVAVAVFAVAAFLM